jgi:dolichol-phosphate mannosyltransferase
MNITSEYQFTIVVPVFDEEDNMARLESTFAAFLPTCIVKACVLFVNDGSRDHSLDKIKEACQRNADFYFISFECNHGLSAAIKAGIDVCESPFIGYIDADLQTTPEDFNKLLESRNDYPLVIGIRAKRKDSWFKRRQSKIANGFRRMMTGDTATDTGCPLKVINTAYAKRIPFFTGMHRFLPALIMLQSGGTFKEIPVRHFPREAGKSKFHLSNRLISPFKDCFAYRWMKHRYINYKVVDSKL